MILRPRVAPALALTAAMALATFGIVRGTWAVGGSDSSCYGLMADAFAHLRLQPSSDLVARVPWPDASRTIAPAGFIPSPVRADAASPICAPGMSLLMAPLMWIGGPDALFLLSPIAAGALVWFAFVLARRLSGDIAGAVTAVLVAASPIVLFQAVQPMNDIVTAALWIAAFAAATWESKHRGWMAGLLTGAAVVVRPNLAPLGIAVAVLAPTPAFVIAALPGGALLLALNYALYGSAVGSGYGAVRSLFDPSNVPANLSQYGRTIVATQSAFPLLGLLAPFVVPPEKRRLAWGLLIAAMLVWSIYAFYRSFPEWWYVRFLIPALVMMLVLAAAVVGQAARTAKIGGLIAIATIVLALFMLGRPATRDALNAQRFESRFRDTSQLVRDRLPANAVLITVWQSGSMRFHARRESVMWDALDSEWLDRAVDWLAANGRAPYVLVERREEPEFRARFRGHSALGALDWPPRFDLNRQVRIFDPADRARFRAGETYATENVGTRPPSPRLRRDKP